MQFCCFLCEDHFTKFAFVKEKGPDTKMHLDLL